MTKDQLQAIEQLKDALRVTETEGLTIIFDNTRLHVADDKELNRNGFYDSDCEVEGEMHADEAALMKTERVTLPGLTILVLDKWMFPQE